MRSTLWHRESRRAAVLAVLLAVVTGPWGNASTAAVPSSPMVCSGAPLPPGYAITNGTPHTIKTPYTPNTLHNPVSVVNFTRAVLRDTAYTAPQKKCLVDLGSTALMSRSTTRVVDGQVSRWLPYPFAFSPNPSVETLEPGWISGLAQAGAMTLMIALYRYDGDADWLVHGQQFANSYAVDITRDGFTSRRNGFLWFEEYPSSPPTVVLNGHFQAIMALRSWFDQTGDRESLALFDEAVADLKGLLPTAEVEMEGGGIMSTYDLIRGYPAAPLRIVARSSTAAIDAVTLNGTPEPVPLVEATYPFQNRLANPDLDSRTGSTPAHWTRTGPPRTVTTKGGVVTYRSVGKGWPGVLQDIPAGRIPPGTDLSISYRAQLAVEPGKSGTGGRVSVYALCPTRITLLFESGKFRSPRMTDYNDGTFRAPEAACAIRVQLVTMDYGNTATSALVDRVELRQADWVGASHIPDYDMQVWRTPSNTLTVTGNGKMALQAYAHGRWEHVLAFDVANSSRDITIPERYTGRNINFKYHDGHVSELGSLAALSGEGIFSVHRQRWLEQSPVNNAER